MNGKNCIIVIFVIMQVFIVADTVASKKYSILEEKTLIVVDSTESIVRRIAVRNFYQIYNIMVSPTSKYIAWNELLQYPDNIVCEDKEASLGVLVTMELETGATDTIYNVSDFDWAPNKDKLAFIKYVVVEDKNYGGKYHSGRSVWMYDAETELSYEIRGYVGSEYYSTYFSLYWSEYKNLLCITYKYLTPDSIYDPDNGNVTVSWGYNIKVAPDGKYGFYDTIDDEAEVYDIENDEWIKLLPDDDWGYGTGEIYAHLLEWGKLDGKTIAYIRFMELEYVDCATGRMYKVIPPSPEIDPINDLVGFRDGRPVWARITGDKAELFYY